MKKKILLCSILCLLFLIAGCSAAEKNTGKNETATQPAAENWNTEKESGNCPLPLQKKCPWKKKSDR